MSEWIEWNGGEMPVPKGTKITVKHRDRSIFDDLAGGEYSHDWNSEGYSGDIIAYMIHEPKGHPNASILMEIAKEAAINEEYWKEFGWIGKASPMLQIFADQNDLYNAISVGSHEIRRKPRTIRIGNYDVPEPINTIKYDNGVIAIAFDSMGDCEIGYKALQELLAVKK